MRELGIDLAHQRPHRLTKGDMEWADVVVRMGCGDECPYIPGKRYIDWELEDPAGQPIGKVVAVRDQIQDRACRLAEELHAREAHRAGSGQPRNQDADSEPASDRASTG